MSFQFDFEELPLTISGVKAAPLNGTAEFTSGGDVSGVFLEDVFDSKSTRRVYLTGKSSDEFKNALFRIIALEIRTQHADRIQECLADVKRSNVLNYFDQRRKMAAEMSS